MRLYVSLFMLIALSACTPKGSGNGSTISLSIPTLGELNSKGSLQKVSSLAVNASSVRWDDACFMVAANAADIPNPSTSSCDLPSGVFKGSVPPSKPGQPPETLSLEEFPKGEGRRFDVYAYFHAAGETCPSYTNLNMYNKSRVARLGFVENVSIQKDKESINIDISLPSQMIIAEAHLAPSCSGPASSRSNVRGVAGSQPGVHTLVNNYTVTTAVGGPGKKMIITPNSFKVYRKRGSAQ